MTVLLKSAVKGFAPIIELIPSCTQSISICSLQYLSTYPFMSNESVSVFQNG